MSRIFYSIIVPHFNCLEGLALLLDSIPDRPDIEIVIVDDNSDNYALISDAVNLINTCVSIVKNTSGVKGAGVCRNIGMSIAKGRYFIFADSDDLFVDDAFSKIDDVIEKNGNSDIIYFKPTSKCTFTGEESDRHLLYCQVIDSYIKESDQSLLYKFVVPWSKVFSKEFLTKNNILFDQVIASNDVMFSMRANYYSSHSVVVDDIIYCVTRRPGSLTVTKTKAVNLARYTVEKDRIEFIVTNKLDVNTNSVISMLKNYHKSGVFNVLIYTCSALLSSKISFFPKHYTSLILKPKLLVEKLFYKNSINDCKYKGES